MTTTTTTHPFGAIAEQMQASWECRPSLLAFCGVPENTTELRARWFSVYRHIFNEWLRQCSAWSLSEEAAEQIIEERVGAHVHENCSMEIDSFLLWSFLKLTGKDNEAKLFEYVTPDGQPDEREFCSPYRLRPEPPVE